jgi:surface polysaccharide O-acyltransferase-like enzyme
MTAYLKHTQSIAQKTPETRNRVIDFWRVVAILVVVLGHWLAASIWLMPDGEIALLNSLEWIPYAGWVTWVVQVMPIFFFVGGYANARGLAHLEDSGTARAAWVTTRTRRLFTPVIPLLITWTVLIVVLGPFVPTDVVRAGAMSATVPLWFMAVYVMLTAIAPWTYRWWRAHGLGSVVALGVAAIAVDIARFAGDVPGIGWVNFFFVWAMVHQLGYFWNRRDTQNEPISGRQGVATFGISLGVLIAVTWSGLYPVAMVGVPGSELTNMTPPTFAIALLGLVQAGVLWATQTQVRAFANRRGVWHFVVSVSGVIMTLYLWHLTAMTLVASVFLFAFGGAAFKIEPGTTQWWLTRPIWIGALAFVTALLVAVFARFEWKINQNPAPSKVRYVVAGVLLLVGSAAAVAYFGLATQTATVNWIIPIAAIAGAALIGAIPQR